MSTYLQEAGKSFSCKIQTKDQDSLTYTNVYIVCFNRDRNIGITIVIFINNFIYNIIVIKMAKQMCTEKDK